MPILLPEQTDVVAFGDFLRHAREQRGLTLQQIARETRIPWRHLDALEHGDLAAVPSGMYRRAEIRAYADAVGLDRGLALAQLEHALEYTEPHARDTRSRPTPWYAMPGVRFVAAAAAATAATLAALTWWEARGAVPRRYRRLKPHRPWRRRPRTSRSSLRPILRVRASWSTASVGASPR
jgi:cytoskeletal protein RodZ